MKITAQKNAYARKTVALLQHGNPRPTPDPVAAAPERQLRRPDATRGTGAAAEPIGGSGGAALESWTQPTSDQ